MAALKDRNELAVFTLLSEAITAFGNAATEPFASLLFDTLVAGARAAQDNLRKQRILRAAADEKVDFAFDRTNPKAKQWAEEHAAELITGLSETDRNEVRELVEAAFEEQFDVDELADRITEVIGDADRADVIARTETMRASNEGQSQLWGQAVDAGLLTGLEQKEWITTPDDRLCPICEPMDGETVGLNERFSVEGDSIDGPPAHPSCRCTLGLSVS